MASAFRVLRIARSSQALCRPIPTARRTPITTIAARSYATTETRPAADQKPVPQAEQASEDLTITSEDPNLNGSYPDPSLTSALPIKRQFRDPYAGWWDPQERRNYGETVHEDNDILGIFSPEEYTHVTPAWGAVEVLIFITAFCSVLLAVARVYPDTPAFPRTFPGGLEAELGGSGALRARSADDGDDI